MTVTVDAHELEQFARAVKTWPVTISRASEPEFKTLARGIRLNVQKQLTWNRGTDATGGLFTGKLRRSINDDVRQSVNGELFATVHTDLPRAIYVEEDTLPHFPPLRALENWARFHNTTPYVVARAIAQRGTKGRHMFRNAAEWARQRMPQTAQSMARKIMPKLRVK